MSELADIEDGSGKVIGKIDLSSMRVVAPNREVDRAISDGELLYMNKNGIRSILSAPAATKRR
ncbi:hypothetical protein [Devosia alba]|uniref:hypothetical protein n=1 Tax=Devosia alba TaxID=3152360 RepID=UPI0032646EDA